MRELSPTVRFAGPVYPFIEFANRRGKRSVRVQETDETKEKRVRRTVARWKKDSDETERAREKDEDRTSECF